MMRSHSTLTLALAGIVIATVAAAPVDLRVVEAARNGDTTQIRTLIDQRADVLVRQKDGTTALHWAVYRDDAEMVDVLIRAGGNPSAANDLGATPLWLAAQNGNARIARRLLEAGADPNATLNMGESVVMIAAHTGSADIVEQLLKKGAEPNTRGPRGQTALMWAVAQGHPAVVKTLLAHGAGVHDRASVWTAHKKTDSEQSSHPDYQVTLQQGGETSLLFAARGGDVASARLLIDAGANVNDRSADGTSATTLAAHSDHADLVALLLERGADPNADASGYTALHAAILRRNPRAVASLLTHGANPNAPLRSATPTRRDADDFYFHNTFIGATPIWLAARFSQPEVMRLLAAHGADPRVALDVQYPAGSYGTYDRAHEGPTTILMAATGMGGKGTRGWAQPAAADRRALTIEAVRAAVELGADLNTANADGNTALHGAAARELDAVVQYLSEKGADRTIKNKQGATALDEEWLEFSSGGRGRRRR